MFIVSEVIVILLFGAFTFYGSGVHPGAAGTASTNIAEVGNVVVAALVQRDSVQAFYPMY